MPPGCVVAMEACSGAHAWGRRLRAMGLDARLIAAGFVSPHRMQGKSGKNDMTDAATDAATDPAAVCEAASRPTMRYVPIKTAEQRGVMVLHRMREGFKEERKSARPASTGFEACWRSLSWCMAKAPKCSERCWPM